MNYLKRNKLIKNTIKSLLLLIMIIPFTKCNLFKGNEYEIYRIIDNLSQENIIETPFKDIMKKFMPIEEEITGKWKYIPELSNKNEEIWGFSSKHLILGNHKLERPEEIQLIKNGKEVKYLSRAAKGKEGWMWIGTNETLDLRNYHVFNDKFQGIVINRGESFKFEKLFPEGEVIIDMRIVNKNYEIYRPKLEIFFNNNKIKEITITKKKLHRIKNKVNLGKYSIEIKYTHSEAGGVNKVREFVIISKIKINNSSDILLISKPRKEKRASPQGKFLFKYYTFGSLPDKRRQSFLLENLYLYDIKNKYPIYDLGIGENPYSLKKKILFDEYSLNTLMALPRSEFAISLKIPSRAILEFGYGFMNKSKKISTKKIINFKITISNSKEEKVLMNKNLNPRTIKEISSEKIDLSSFGKNKMKLSFITEKILSNKEENNELDFIPVWINPIIYQPPAEDKINIVLISLDTLRPDHLGCYGYKRNTSPAIDKFAKDGVLFSNVYSTTSWTLPAHISMLTSLNSIHHKVYYPRQKMGVETITLADLLRINEFYTAGFTGGGYLSSNYGFSKGFDSYQEFKIYGNKALRYDEAEYLAKKACDWLDTNKDKKFFLFIHTYQPHEPYANLSPLGKIFLTEHSKWDKIKMESLFDEKGRFGTKFSKKEINNIIDLYDGEIRYTDGIFVKPVIDKLKEWNLYDKTMIILTSDHGEEFYDHEAWLHDHSIYNEGLKIPLIIKFPNSYHKGKRINYIVRITDIMPTILDQMKIKLSSPKFDGKSLLPLIEGKEKKDRIYISDLALRGINVKTYPDLIAMNNNNFKLIFNKEVKSPYVQRISKKFKGKKIELYDIKKDPKETKNLALQIQYRELCFELLKKIYQYYEKIDKKITEREEVILDKNLKERLRALGYIK